MAPKRKDPSLPPRVIYKHGAYYYLKPVIRQDKSSTQWIRLGETQGEMWKGLGDLMQRGNGIMSAVIQRYRNEILPSKAKATQKQQKRQLDKLNKVFGHMQPRHIRPHHIAKLHDIGRNTPYEANRELALLKHVLKYAVRWGHLETNPAREIQRHTEKPRTRYVTNQEFEAVRNVAADWVALLMDLAYITGQRRVDLLKLRRQDMQAEGLLIEQSKTGTRLLLEWTPALQAVCKACLDAQQTQSIWLVCNRHGQQQRDAAFTTAWTRLMNKCLAQGVITEKFQFRDLRAKAGSDSSGEQLGHKNKAILERHYRRLPKHVKPTK